MLAPVLRPALSIDPPPAAARVAPATRPSLMLPAKPGCRVCRSERTVGDPGSDRGEL